MAARRGSSSSLHPGSRTRRVAAATPRLRELALTITFVLLSGLSPLGQHEQRVSRSPNTDRVVEGLLTNAAGPDAARVIIRTRNRLERESLKNRLQAHGDHIRADHESIGAFTATVHVADLDALANDPAIESVSIDAVVTAHQRSGTAQPWVEQWPPLDVTATQTSTSSLLGTQLLPDTGATGSGVRIAIIDSGLQLTTDLTWNRVLGFYDLTRNDFIVPAWPYDDYGHGTHVTGLIAGDGANSEGFYSGLAPAATVLALKVLDKEGSGYTSDVIQAIEFILANQELFRIDVINLSLGHPILESATTDPLVLAVEKATKAGIVVVVAAGNYGQDPGTGLPASAGITSPGNAPSAITVGALDTRDTIDRGDDTVAVYSSRGPTWYDAYAKPDLVAPGHQLVAAAALRSTLYRDYAQLRVAWGTDDDVPRYFRLSGTSMAAAVTSGAVALMLDAADGNRPLVTPNLVKALLEWSAIPIAGYDTLAQGTGSLNVAGALALVRAIDPRLPVGADWLTAAVTPFTTIAGTDWLWAQMIVWGNTPGYGSLVDTNVAAWGKTVIWGNRATVIWGNGKTVIWGNGKTVIWGNGKTVIWGNGKTVIWGNGKTVIWGNTVLGSDVVWSNPTAWASSVVWGNGLIGTIDGTTVTWGNTDVTASTVVWGNLATVTGVSGDSGFADIQR